MSHLRRLMFVVQCQMSDESCQSSDVIRLMSDARHLMSGV